MEKDQYAPTRREADSSYGNRNDCDAGHISGHNDR